jgi:dethiobiotin synthetase
LLSIAQLQQAGVPIAGIVFNGPATPSTESVILRMTKVPLLFRIPELRELSLPAIDETARLIKPQLIETLLH